MLFDDLGEEGSESPCGNFRVEGLEFGVSWFLVLQWTDCRQQLFLMDDVMSAICLDGRSDVINSC